MTNQNFKQVAGLNGGKKVMMAPACVPAFQQLKAAAGQGNHWAHVAVSTIRGLETGRLGKDNIFVHPSLEVVRGRQEFVAVLPGCTVAVERQMDDTYRVLDIRLDFDNYDSPEGTTNTGLYKADNRDGKWFAESVADGKLGTTNQNIVAIADSGYNNAQVAADSIAPMASKAPNAGSTFFREFHLHYTKGGKRLGGLRNFKQACNPNNNKDIHGSAMMLAKTMHAAKDIPEVSWVSVLGGSAVLTQALTILAQQNIQLNNHTAYLFRPSTNVETAVNAAHQVNLTLDRNFVKTLPGDFMGNRNQFGMIRKRFKNEKNYKIGNAAWDVMGQITNVQGMAAATIAGLGAAGVSFALPAAAIPVAAKISAVLGTTIAGLAAGDSIANNLAPHFYNKHIGKIK